MKKTYKIISTIAIILFVISFVLRKLEILIDYNSVDLQSTLILIYFFTNLKYFQMETDDKDAEILDLKFKLKQFEK